MIRAVVAEDSLVQRELLLAVLGEAKDLSVAGVANDGREAVELCARLRPDVVLMDCNMPQLDGVEATREIVAARRTPIVMCSASLAPTDLLRTFDGLEAGALAVAAKPNLLDADGFATSAANLITALRRAAAHAEIGFGPAETTPVAYSPPPAMPIRLAAIAGGPGTVSALVPVLTAAAGACFPLLAVQRVGAGLLPVFADWLQTRCGLPVSIAAAGETVLPGHCYLAPEGAALGIDADGRVTLATDPLSVAVPGSFLIRSAGEQPGALRIVLSSEAAEGVATLATEGRETRGLGAICRRLAG